MDRIFPAFGRKSDPFRLAYANHGYIITDDSDFVNLFLQISCNFSATFVTNAVAHAKKLAVSGFHVILVGGELKGTTEAVVGNEAILSIQNYNFTKGFFGTNGVSKRHGFTTPDPNEALVKQEAMRQTERCYVLADSQKFGMVSSVTFGGFEEATILTETEPPEGFSGSKNIRVAK